MFIYMVVAKTDGVQLTDQWNVKAFKSSEKAREFIEDFDTKLAAAKQRIRELRNLRDERDGLTREEQRELYTLQYIWRKYESSSFGWLTVEAIELCD